MLFVTIAKGKEGSTSSSRIGRRAQWSYPEGIEVVAEYWPVGSDISVILISKADSVAPIMAALSQWDDVLSFRVHPVITAEDGIALAAQMQ